MERFVGKLLFLVSIPVILIVMGGLFYYYQVAESKGGTGGETDGPIGPHPGPAVHLSGKIFFVSKIANSQRLNEIDPDTGSVRTVLKDVNVEKYISVSRSAREIAYGTAGGGNSAISIMELSGGEPEQVTKPGYNLMPAFSPDGGKLVFVQQHDGGFRSLLAVDLKTHRISPFIKPKHWYSDPFFLPDGRLVCTAYLGSKDQIVVLDPVNDNEINLTNNDYDNMRPSATYDGKKIVFISNRDGNPEIYTMNADGTEIHRLTLTTGVDYQDPYWSPDGKYIVYSSAASGGNGLYDLYVMNENGDVIKQLTKEMGNNFSGGWYNPTP